MKVAAIYIRVSTDEQARDGYSLDAQIKAIKEYARKNNFIIDSNYIYKDEGISGRTAEKRPAFMQMIAIAKTKPYSPFDVVLVHKLDRFARNRKDSIVYKTLLKKDCKVDVISISEDFGDHDASIILEANLEAFAEYYSINLSREVKKGLREKATKGEILSRPPFGYRAQNGTFQPDSNAKIVKMVYNDYNDGLSFKTLAMKLNKMGIRTINNKKWEVRTIEYILRNPTYKGYILWTENSKNTWNITQRHKDGILTKGNFEPIIDEKLFDSVQKKILANKEKYKHQTNSINNHWLRKLIKCSNCGSTLTITQKAFQCIGYSHGSCDKSHYITIHKVETAVLKDLKRIFNDNKIEINIVKKDTPENNQLQILEDRIEKINDALNRAKNLYLEGIDTLEEYKKVKLQYETNLNEIQNELSNLPIIDTKANINNIKIKAKSVYDLLIREDIETNIKYDIMHDLIDKIVYNKDNQTLDIFYKE